MEEFLTKDERTILLDLARKALIAAVNRLPPPDLDLSTLPDRLRQLGASFVTLTRAGELRGCIGALEATLPLAQDVMEHAAAAALYDFRFQPVRPEELEEIQIEISRLTIPSALEYSDSNHLLRLLRPGVDGVVLRDGRYRATFLPQVWEKLSEPDQFLDHLCDKMGVPFDLWRRKKLDVSIYQVEEFQELKTERDDSPHARD